MHGSSRVGIVARPELVRRLSGSARATVITASAGSGKTVLLRSWLRQPHLQGRAAWVAARRDDGSAQRFWIQVIDALRQTAPGAVLVRPVTPAPDTDGWAIAEQLVEDVTPLDEPLWLVVDDLHELDPETVRQLGQVIMKAPEHLRFVLTGRHDVRLGLHRLRLEGALAEIRSADLRFTLEEAKALLAAAGLDLPLATVATLHERTEGWAAGLRLAALSLAGHPDPDAFAARFSGTERTVAEYLVAEVLHRQPEPVRRLLLRTSILERMNGELAVLLTGDEGGERTLRDLEQANAFVMPLGPDRFWFRYHQLFAGLLRLELQRTAPEEVIELHRAAAGWFEGHGDAVAAIRHAQAARDWPFAARLLVAEWHALHLDGRGPVIHKLLSEFPTEVIARDPDLAAVAAADELARGSLDAAERHLDLAERQYADASAGRTSLLPEIVRLLVARQRIDVPAVLLTAERLGAMAEAPEAARSGLGADLRALALISLGSAELWCARFEDAWWHLEQGRELAHQVNRPYLELTALSNQTVIEHYRSYAETKKRGAQAHDLARQHGWSEDPVTAMASIGVGAVLGWQARIAEAEPWIQHAERTVEPEAEPAGGLLVRYVRGVLELQRGAYPEALAAFRDAEPLTEGLATDHYLRARTRAWIVQTLVRSGEIEYAERALDDVAAYAVDRAEIRIARAVLRLAQDDPAAAASALAPVLDGSAPVTHQDWLPEACLLEAIAQDRLGEPAAAGAALERALDLVERDGALMWFVLHPAPGLLRRHALKGTAHAGMIADILDLLHPGHDGAENGQPGQRKPQEPTDRARGEESRAGAGSGTGHHPELTEALSDSELRVLRYLPTNLPTSGIADELGLSRNTVKTHIRNVYTKLGTNRRTQTVGRARELGLLTPFGPNTTALRPSRPLN